MTNRSAVCLITGASSGIGLATARRFAEAGFCIAICGRDTSRLREAEQIIRSLCPNKECVAAVVADVGRLADCQDLVNRVAEEFGRLDVLVNNAGVAPLAAIVETRDADFESVMNINQRAVFATTRAVWPIMRRQSSGTIINISSQAAVDPFPGFSIYGASKAWVDLFTKATADEGKPHGIRAFSLRLGAVETPLLRRLFPDFPEEQALAPQEVAEFVFSVTKDALRFASGSAIPFKR